MNGHRTWPDPTQLDSRHRRTVPKGNRKFIAADTLNGSFIRHRYIHRHHLGQINQLRAIEEISICIIQDRKHQGHETSGHEAFSSVKSGRPRYLEHSP
jgi:hypothetical protein